MEEQATDDGEKSEKSDTDKPAADTEDKKEADGKEATRDK